MLAAEMSMVGELAGDMVREGLSCYPVAEDNLLRIAALKVEIELQLVLACCG